MFENFMYEDFLFKIAELEICIERLGLYIFFVKDQGHTVYASIDI